MESAIIVREKYIPGCDSVIIPEPLKTFKIEGSNLIPVDVDLTDYKKIGSSKDYDYFSKV